MVVAALKDLGTFFPAETGKLVRTNWNMAGGKHKPVLKDNTLRTAKGHETGAGVQPGVHISVRMDQLEFTYLMLLRICHGHKNTQVP